MKKGLIIFTLISLIAVQAMAQDGKRRGRGRDMTPEERLEKHMARLDEQLELRDDQEVEIKAILAKSQEEMGEIREEMREAGKEDREAFKERLATLRDNTNEEILAVLDDEQDARFAEMTEKRHERMKKRMGKRRHHGGHNRGDQHRGDQHRGGHDQGENG